MNSMQQKWEKLTLADDFMLTGELQLKFLLSGCYTYVTTNNSDYFKVKDL